jgi:SAM-dependent methyltransferase
VSGFSEEWLALREPYDARARNPGIIDAVVAALAEKTSIRVVDLACGSGSTPRAVARRLPVRQHWRLVDNDPGLLARVAASHLAPDVMVETVALDLDRDLDMALDGAIDLVTASALLDLVSRSWLERLADRLVAGSLPFYAALTYDGRIEIGASHPLDAAVVAAVNAHQRGDKGFGPALGPTASEVAIACLQARGYSVVQGVADWVIGSQDRAIQFELFTGWARAAGEMGELTQAELARWLEFHRTRIVEGRSSLRVGHVDVFAWPTRSR